MSNFIVNNLETRTGRTAKGATCITCHQRLTRKYVCHTWQTLTMSSPAFVYFHPQCVPAKIVAQVEKHAYGAPEAVYILERLTEKVERANSIQHSGGAILPEDWSELYQLANESRAFITKAKGQTP